MQQDINTYNVNIAGQPLRLKATHDQTTVDEILNMVESHLDRSKDNNTSRQHAALLTCLHLAEELYFLRKKTKEELDNLESLAKDHLSQMQIS